MFNDLMMLIVFVLAGLVLILLEILTPSFGLIALMAIASLAAGGYFAFRISSTAGVVTVIAMIIGTPIYLSFLVRWLPKTPLGRHLFLKHTPAGEGDAVPEDVRNRQLLGQEGQAMTTLRPSGTIIVQGRRYSALSESGLITRGTSVRVVHIDGSSIIVRKIDAASAQES